MNFNKSLSDHKNVFSINIIMYNFIKQIKEFCVEK